MKQKGTSTSSRWIARWRGLTGVSLAGVVFLSSLMAVAAPWQANINGALGIDANSIERSQNPEDYRFLSDYQDPNDLIQAEIALNTRMSAEGSVLLKGNPVVGGSQMVTLFGMRSEKIQYGGTMGAVVSATQAVSLAEALTENGFSVNPTMTDFYQSLADTYTPGTMPNANCVNENGGFRVNEVPISEYGEDLKASYAEYQDAAIIVLGRDATEGSDYYPGEDGQLSQAEAEAQQLTYTPEFTQSPTGNVLSLSDNERDLIEYVKQQGFAKIIVLLNADNSLEIQELKQDGAISSILWIGTPGCYGTYGIAQLLAGTAQPSGHLTDTYAVNTAKAPAVVNFGAYPFANASEIDKTPNNALRSNWYLVENESIYIGYKYYETRYYDAMLEQGNASQAAHGESFDGGDVWQYDSEVSYPFGYGLEGSTFEEKILDLSIDWTGETDSTATVQVTNTGDTAAKHVVQLYVSVPYTDADRAAGIEKSAIQLMGYAKTGEASETDFTQSVLLQPGEAEEVTIHFNAKDMMSYDAALEHDGVTGGYRLAAGSYYFATGNGAHEAVNAVLTAQYPDRFTDLTASGDCRKETLDQEVQKTESNGTLIQNQLEQADLNSWQTNVTVKQLSRSDWAATWPQEITDLTATGEMIPLLRNVDVNESIIRDEYDGPAKFAYHERNGIVAADLVGLDYDDPMYEQAIDQLSLQDLIDVYIARSNVLSAISLPKVNGADSPSGINSRFGAYTAGSIFEIDETDPAYGYETNVYTGENIVAATFSHLLPQEEGRLIGNDSLWTGVHTWNAPGVNIHRTQYNGRNEEYYSEDAVLNGTMAANLIRGAQSKGLVVFMKHYALNDQETNRDGVAVFISEQAARENDLRGFEIAIRNVEVSGIMTSFNRVGCTHTAASTGLCNGILRGEWGYQGRLISDSVKSAQYFQPTECLLTTHDLMLGATANGKAWNYTEEALASDALVQNGLREAFHKYLYVMVNSNLLNGITAETSVANALPWWQLVLYGGMAAFGALVVVFGCLWGITVHRTKKAATAGKEE